MLRVRMKTMKAGPGGVALPGQVVSVPPEEAEALVKGGYAEWIENPPKPARTEKVETTAAHPPENTAKRSGGKKGS